MSDKPASKDTHPAAAKRYRIAVVWDVTAPNHHAASNLGEAIGAFLAAPHVGPAQGVYVCTEVEGRVGKPEESMILGEIGS